MEGENQVWPLTQLHYFCKKTTLICLDGKSMTLRLVCAKLQSTLGFETLDKAAALGLETATPLTDPRQYINSNLGFRNLKI